MPDAAKLKTPQEPALSAASYPSPEPLMGDIPPGATFPTEALGPVLGAAAGRIAAVVQCPRALAAQSVMAACSLATQGFANVIIDGRVRPISTYHLSVALSGDRKSASDDLALREHATWEKQADFQYKARSTEYAAAMEAYECQRQATKKETKDAAKLASKLLGIAQPDKPISPTILVDEPTLEGLHKAYRYGMPSQGLFSDEGGRFFGGFGMGKDHVLKTIAGLSHLWDGKPISRTRSADGESFKLYDRRLSVHLMVQPVVAETVLSNPLMMGQGFLPRFLVTWSESMQGSRPYRALDATTDPELMAYWDAVRKMLDTPLRMDEAGGPILRNLPLTPDGKRMWIAIHDRIEVEIKAGGSFRDIAPIAAKAAENVLRLAGQQAIFANPDCTAIDSGCVERAGHLISFYLNEAVRLSAVAVVDAALHTAKGLLEWLIASNSPVIPLQAVYQLSPSGLRLRTARSARDAMKTLERHHYLFPMPGGCVVDGKPVKEAWMLSPHLISGGDPR